MGESAVATPGWDCRPRRHFPASSSPPSVWRSLKRRLAESGQPDLFEMIQHLATRSWTNPELLRVVGRRLADLFHGALREPPMRSLNMLSVPLQSGSTELPSDIEVVEPGPTPTPRQRSGWAIVPARNGARP